MFLGTKLETSVLRRKSTSKYSGERRREKEREERGHHPLPTHTCVGGHEKILCVCVCVCACVLVCARALLLDSLVVVKMNI